MLNDMHDLQKLAMDSTDHIILYTYTCSYRKRDVHHNTIIRISVLIFV